MEVEEEILADEAEFSNLNYISGNLFIKIPRLFKKYINNFTSLTNMLII
jgi:hypothetical protein